MIRPRVVGLCGTDLDIIAGTIDPAFVGYPIVLGHEFAGELALPLGELPRGTRVVAEGIVPCGVCASCLAGATNRCVTYDEIGFTRDGAAAERLVVPGHLVHPIDDNVSWESAALVEPASVVWRALTRAQPPAGGRVLIIGDGTIAMLAATLVRQFDPTQVVVLGAREEQRALSQHAGVDVFTTDAAEAGGEFDLVVDAAGTAAATQRALATPARGGTVLLLGYPGAQRVELPVDDIVNGDVVIIGSFSYTRSAWAEVVALLNDGRLDLGWLITHRFPIADFETAIDTLRHNPGVRGKVLLDVAPLDD